MKTYTITAAYNIPCYAAIEIEAATPELAVEAAKELFKQWTATRNSKLDNKIFDPQFDDSSGHRIISVYNDDDVNTIECLDEDITQQSIEADRLEADKQFDQPHHGHEDQP